MQLPGASLPAQHSTAHSTQLPWPWAFIKQALAGRLIHWLAGGLIHWLAGGLIHWLAGGLMH